MFCRAKNGQNWVISDNINAAAAIVIPMINIGRHSRDFPTRVIPRYAATTIAGSVMNQIRVLMVIGCQRKHGRAFEPFTTRRTNAVFQ